MWPLFNWSHWLMDYQLVAWTAPIEGFTIEVFPPIQGGMTTIDWTTRILSSLASLGRISVKKGQTLCLLQNCGTKKTIVLLTCHVGGSAELAVSSRYSALSIWLLCKPDREIRLGVHKLKHKIRARDGGSGFVNFESVNKSPQLTVNSRMIRVVTCSSPTDLAIWLV